MSEFEIDEMEKQNADFTEKMLNKGCVIPEINDVITHSPSDEVYTNGKFVALYSLKTIVDDEPFYFSPFVALDENDMKYQLSCCNNYKMLICRIGYYDCASGSLYTDYAELDTVHDYFMIHSDKYREITEVFGNITADEIPSVYGSVCEMIVESDKNNKEKLDSYIDFLRSNHIYVPEVKSDDKRILKRMFQTMKEFVTP